MSIDDYKIVVRANKTPIGKHVRQYNAPTIDEEAIFIIVVDEEFDSRNNSPSQK